MHSHEASARTETRTGGVITCVLPYPSLGLHIGVAIDMRPNAKFCEIGSFCLRQVNDIIDACQHSTAVRFSEMASGIVQAAIAQLINKESSFMYTERGKAVSDLCRKITKIVIQESNVELFNGFV